MRGRLEGRARLPDLERDAFPSSERLRLHDRSLSRRSPAQTGSIAERFEAGHRRFPRVGQAKYRVGQRAEQLAGVRNRLYFTRGRILQLALPAESYFIELMHERPHKWKRDVEHPFARIQRLGEWELPARATRRPVPGPLECRMHPAGLPLGGRLLSLDAPSLAAPSGTDSTPKGARGGEQVSRV